MSQPTGRAECRATATPGKEGRRRAVWRIRLAGHRALTTVVAFAALIRHRRWKHGLSDEEFFADEFWARWRAAAQASARGWQPDPQVKEEALRRIKAVPRTP